VDKIEVEREGSVRRAKLTYLRGRIGKGAMAVKEKDTLRDKLLAA
jgi:large subunit ribosomal protein L19